MSTSVLMFLYIEVVFFLHEIRTTIYRCEYTRVVTVPLSFTPLISVDFSGTDEVYPVVMSLRYTLYLSLYNLETQKNLSPIRRIKIYILLL